MSGVCSPRRNSRGLGLVYISPLLYGRPDVQLVSTKVSVAFILLWTVLGPWAGCDCERTKGCEVGLAPEYLQRFKESPLLFRWPWRRYGTPFTLKVPLPRVIWFRVGCPCHESTFQTGSSEMGRLHVTRNGKEY